MGKKKTKSKRNSELRIIFFIILIAAVLFIISTYAWFTTQKNVSITNLQGVVEVAEGLEISLDAKVWANEIVLGTAEGQLDIIEDAYPGHRNIHPVEMLPVSTSGEFGSVKHLQMLRGKLTNSITPMLSEIVAMDETLAKDPDKTKHDGENAKYPGYFAFDIFLKNSSKEDIADPLQLNYDSSVQITEADNAITGLQNTVRVAFARYGVLTKEGNGVAGVNANQADILAATGAKNDDQSITDVAIWEPNAGDHAEYIVTNNNKITWSTDDAKVYATETLEDGVSKGFGVSTQMPTYSLMEASKDQIIHDIYHWDLANKYTCIIGGIEHQDSNADLMTKQRVVQTNKTSAEDYSIKEGVQHLLTSDASKSGEDAYFKIAPNSVIRLRVYVWLEGQDIDCINYASHGGGVTVNIGLVKGSKVGSHGEVPEGSGT